MFSKASHRLRYIQKNIIQILLSFTLIACSQSEQDNKSLLYWSANNPYEIDFADSIVTRWNNKYPEKPVRFQPVPEGRSSEEFILAAVVGKTTPDMYSNMWQGDVETYARAGVLVPLDTLDGFLEYIYQRCDSSVISEVTSSDGHIYQIPWKINPIMLLYNKNMMESAGFIEPPATYSEYLQAAAKISVDVDGDGYVDRWVGYRNVLVTWLQRLFDFYALYLGASDGAKLVDGDKIVFNNKAAIETFRFLQKIYANNYFSKEMLSARQDVFLGEFIASRFTGPWEIAHAEKFKPEGFRYSFSHLPVPDDHEGDIYTYGDPKNIVIFNTCRNPQQAWEFLSFVINKENDHTLLEITTQLPRRKNLFENPYFKNYFDKNPKMVPFAKQARFVKGTDPCPVLKEIFDIISQEYEACVIHGVKSPEDAIADAAKSSQLLLD